MEFAQKKFKNLQKIQLDHNKLQTIEPGAFHKLTGLIELDLSDNQLEQLELEFGGQALAVSRVVQSITPNANPTSQPWDGAPKSFLQDLVQLRHLNMNSNRLKRIGSLAFSPTVQLRQLYLSR